ncbi:MAG: polymer-forming cytoskeletal protein [Micavibrio sp.]|nr:polymer-forming cytoskeletal protein [Micavibrio sp.]
MKIGESAATIIGSSAKLRGELISSEDVLIEGQIDGSVSVEGGRLTIGREALVRADLRAREIVVLGKVEGKLQAEERIELRSTASVVGNLYSKRLSIEADATLRGFVDPAGDAAAAEPVVAEEPAQAAAETAVEAGTPSLFGGPRVQGTMPAGLAAAARSFGQGSVPVGVNALVEEQNHEA